MFVLINITDYTLGVFLLYEPNLFEPLINSLFELGKVLYNWIFIPKLPNFIQYETQEYKSDTLAFSIGKKANGEDIWIYLNQSPHTLLVGQTGWGKSVCIKSILLSIISNYDVELYLADLKRIELSFFRDIKQCKEYVYTVDDTVEVIDQLLDVCEERYSYMESLGISDLSFDTNKRYKPIIFVLEEIILLTSDKKAFKQLYQLLAISRACNIYCFITTQRADGNILTPILKSLLNNRIVFRVQDKQNSIVALDTEGAELLDIKGRFLYSSTCNCLKGQGFYISDEELKNRLAIHRIKNKVCTIDKVDTKEAESTKPIIINTTDISSTPSELSWLDNIN